ncbi:metallophosphoesterase [Ruminococcaceae bacterium OttesenSCG-928-L11]|nr:metallophosphoesterase [Ruminococcaceae bacterium OttesenSCG-928-L11]
MAIYAIGDLHLSVAAKKPMDVFPGWDNHAEKLIENWNRVVGPHDTVVLNGDTSWGMTLQQALPDFRLIHQLPGKKIIIKGNHDYWWASATKMRELFAENSLDSLYILHNNSFTVEGVHICGSRGWMFETGERHDEKLINREAMRIDASIRSVGEQEGERLLFLHYPPLYANQRLEPFLAVMHQYGIRRCYYGHIHGAGHKYAVQGMIQGIEFTMISADYIDFTPVLVHR